MERRSEAQNSNEGKVEKKNRFLRWGEGNIRGKRGKGEGGMKVSN